MEPFRPLIGDSVAVTAFNRGELTEGHFLRTASGCMLVLHARMIAAWLIGEVPSLAFLTTR
jgi:CRISPR-associated protein Cas1